MDNTLDVKSAAHDVANDKSVKRIVVDDEVRNAVNHKMSAVITESVGVGKNETLSGEVDAIDSELVKLMVRRMAVADKIAESRRKRLRPVADPAREREVLAHVSREAGPENSRWVRNVFVAIMNSVKARQRLRNIAVNASVDINYCRAFPEMAIVACAGTEGAYAQQATCRMFAVPTIVYFNGFDKVFEAVGSGLCPYGVLPIENSNAGSVASVYDLMQKHRFHIVRGVKLKIEHVLLAQPGRTIKDIRIVKSHPHALAQCNEFLKRNPRIKAVAETNTAMAARQLAASGDSETAVIASRSCAEIYGLSVIAEGIADSDYNYTRFICISRKPETYPNANKSSVMLLLPHRPGALDGVISKFAAIGVNLTKIESRPVSGSDFEFRFVFEFESTPGNREVLALIAELEADPEIEHFTFLGSYEEI